MPLAFLLALRVVIDNVNENVFYAFCLYDHQRKKLNVEVYGYVFFLTDGAEKLSYLCFLKQFFILILIFFNFF